MGDGAGGGGGWHRETKTMQYALTGGACHRAVLQTAIAQYFKTLINRRIKHVLHIKILKKSNIDQLKNQHFDDDKTEAFKQLKQFES